MAVSNLSLHQVFISHNLSSFEVRTQGIEIFDNLPLSFDSNHLFLSQFLVPWQNSHSFVNMNRKQNPDFFFLIGSRVEVLTHQNDRTDRVEPQGNIDWRFGLLADLEN